MGLSGLSLRRPVYDRESDNVTAVYRIFNGTASALPATAGVANSVLSTVASSSTGKALQTAQHLLRMHALVKAGIQGCASTLCCSAAAA